MAKRERFLPQEEVVGAESVEHPEVLLQKRAVGARAIRETSERFTFEEESDRSILRDDSGDISEGLQAVRLTNDPVHDYLRQVGQYELLSAKQEVELSKAIEVGVFAREQVDQQDLDISKQDERDLRFLVRRGEQAKQQMVNANLRLVVSIAKHYVGRGMPLLDLIQEGNLGLMRAVEGFDYARGNKFSTYASWWIRQAITRSVADQSRTIRLPTHKHEKIMKLTRRKEGLTRQLGRTPTTDELATDLDISPDQVADLESAVHRVISLNTPLDDTGESEFGDIISDSQSAAPYEEIDNSTVKAAVWQSVVKHLSVREANVIKQYYGIDGERRTLKQVGEAQGIKGSTAQQIISRSLRKMRALATSQTRNPDEGADLRGLLDDLASQS